MWSTSYVRFHPCNNLNFDRKFRREILEAAPIPLEAFSSKFFLAKEIYKSPDESGLRSWIPAAAVPMSHGAGNSSSRCDLIYFLFIY